MVSGAFEIWDHNYKEKHKSQYFNKTTPRRNVIRQGNHMVMQIHKVVWESLPWIPCPYPCIIALSVFLSQSNLQVTFHSFCKFGLPSQSLATILWPLLYHFFETDPNWNCHCNMYKISTHTKESEKSKCSWLQRLLSPFETHTLFSFQVLLSSDFPTLPSPLQALSPVISSYLLVFQFKNIFFPHFTLSVDNNIYCGDPNTINIPVIPKYILQTKFPSCVT
jgi:hypothetical protein